MRKIAWFSNTKMSIILIRFIYGLLNYIQRNLQLLIDPVLQRIIARPLQGFCLYFCQWVFLGFLYLNGSDMSAVNETQICLLPDRNWSDVTSWPLNLLLIIGDITSVIDVFTVTYCMVCIRITSNNQWQSYRTTIIHQTSPLLWWWQIKTIE